MSTEPDIFDGIIEPPSAANTNYQPIYPFNNATQTASGHSFELDDTPTRERIRLSHRTGTFLEMHPNGDEVHKIYGKGYTIVLGDQEISIGVDGQTDNKCKIVINGDVKLNVKGNMDQVVDGDYNLTVNGYFKQTVGKIASYAAAGDMNITAGASATGTVRFFVGDSVRINGDLGVDGKASATLITSETRVDAKLGMSAGPYGIVTLGGISAGSYIPAITGVVQGTVSVLSPLVMGTNMVYGGILMDPTGGAPLMRSIYDSHTHISASPGSPTSTPLAMMPLP